MSIAETHSLSSSDNQDSVRQRASAKILHLKTSLQERAAPVGQWARDSAAAARQSVEKRPVATAGVSSLLALAGGVALGLLIAGRLPMLRRHAMPVAHGLVGRMRRTLGR